MNSGDKRMKVTMNIECTPEEARSFLGLPDLTPLHQDYLEKMKQLMSANLSSADAEKMMSQWGTMAAGWDQWQKAIWGAAAVGPAKSSAGGPAKS
jgi:hypothetical protein